MNQAQINPDKSIERLKFYNYRYSLDGTTLKIYLSMLCYLKVNFATEKVKITSHILRPFFLNRLEYCLLVYSAIILFFAWYMPTLNRGVFVLFGLFIVFIVIAFIKTENMKSIIYNWIEKDAA